MCKSKLVEQSIKHVSMVALEQTINRQIDRCVDNAHQCPVFDSENTTRGFDGISIAILIDRQRMIECTNE